MASRFVLTLAAASVVLLGASGLVAATSSQQAQAQKEDDFLKGVYVMKETAGLTDPVLKQPVHPKYTSDAMRAKIQGVVELQAVVMPDGTVSRARVTTSLDRIFGLDEQAVIAVKQWTFVPGKLDGIPVPVAVTLNLEFRLHH